MRTELKRRLQERRHWRIRKKVNGTAERPRMSVRFTGRNIYIQFIDDTIGRTVAAASTVTKATGTKRIANVEVAKRMGSLAAEAAKTKGIARVVFDRAGARYHGKVKALADAARESGLQF